MLAGGTAAAADFPYGADLRFDGPQMRGTKRVPVLEIDDGGAAIIDLWCNRVEGEAVIAGDTITIIPKSRTERACPTDQMAADDDLLDALQQVTNWQSSATGVTFAGPRTLSFSFPTN
jgi:heat shock protein HslJ